MRPVTVMVGAFALLGVVCTVVIVVALIMDVRALDQTRGGYEPPYTEYTGTPIDWSQLDRTANGMVGRGRLLNILIDCRSGMISFELMGVQRQWRTFSPRALAVHQPQEACRERGFDPEF